jgi:hypothetical protein
MQPSKGQARLETRDTFPGSSYEGSLTSNAQAWSKRGPPATPMTKGPSKAGSLADGDDVTRIRLNGPFSLMKGPFRIDLGYTLYEMAG